MYRKRRQQSGESFLEFIGGLIVWAIIIWVLIASGAGSYIATQVKEFIDTASSAAKCEITAYSAKPDLFFTDRGPDAGFTVLLTVKNRGETGNIVATAEIKTSEGNFEKSQERYLKASSSHDLSFQFPEPTINVQDVQYLVNCKPN
jgi:hypothetical protein